MNKLENTGEDVTAITREDVMNLTNDDNKTSYAEGVCATLISGGGMVRIFMLAFGLFGLARLFGILVGCL